MTSRTIKVIRCGGLVYRLQASYVDEDLLKNLVDGEVAGAGVPFAQPSPISVLTQYLEKLPTDFTLDCQHHTSSSQTDSEEPDSSGRFNQEEQHHDGILSAPDCLKTVPPLGDNFYLGERRTKLADEIVNRIHQYYERRVDPKALIVCVEGPPGKGKTWLLRIAAEKAGLRLYRPVGLLDKYAGESARHMEQVFQFVSLHGQPVGLLWDEIDEVVLARGHGTDALSRDARNMVAAFFRGLDETSFVLLCTTNTFDVLDKAFRSRVKAGRYTLSGVERDERLQYLKETSARLNLDVDQQTFSDIADCGWYLGYRELDAIAHGLKRYTKADQRAQLAWRDAMKEQRQTGTWGQPTKAEIECGSRVWDVTVSEDQRTIVVSTKGDCAYIGTVQANGMVVHKKRVDAPNDVNSATYSRSTDTLLMATDDGVVAVYGALRGACKASSIELEGRHGYVYDAAQTISQEYLVATKKGWIFGIKAVDQHHQKSIKLNKERLGALYSIDILTRAGDKSCFLVRQLGHEEALQIGTVEGSFGSLGNPRIQWHLNRNLEITETKERRPQLFHTTDGRTIICLHTDDYVQIWQWSETHELGLLNNIRAEKTAVAALDPVLGRVAVLCKDRILIYPTYHETSTQEPMVVELGQDGGDEITVARFAAFGQVLVWATYSGMLFSTKWAPMRTV